MQTIPRKNFKPRAVVAVNTTCKVEIYKIISQPVVAARHEAGIAQRCLQQVAAHPNFAAGKLKRAVCPQIPAKENRNSAGLDPSVGIWNARRHRQTAAQPSMTSDSKADAEKRRYLLRHYGRCNEENGNFAGLRLTT